MKNHDTEIRPRPVASVVERLRNAKSKWHRTFTDYALSFLSVFVGIAVFAAVLYAPSEEIAAVAPNGAKNAVQVVSVDAAPIPAESQCVQKNWQPTKRLLVLAAQTQGGEFAPQLVALRETLASYFEFSVQLESDADYSPDMLRDLAGLVIVGNAEFADPAAVRAALNDARAGGLPVAWIGLYGADFSDELGLSFGPAIAGLEAGGMAAQLAYNGVTVSLQRQPLSPRFPAGLASDEKFLGQVLLEGETTQAAIVANDRRVYVGFLPFDRFNANLSLTATIDALSYVFGRHQRDPRVLFRLEDINGLTYAQGDETFSRTAEFLLENQVFMHLAIIPEAVDEDQSIEQERVLADIGAAPSVVKLVKDHPEAVAIVQHGLTHSRRDPRNIGCDIPGCAFEFFLDDDLKMGAEAAKALARDRFAAGKQVVERHLGPVVAFEAPHYVLSSAQAVIAEEMYSLLFHPVSRHAGTETGFFMPWITHRDTTVYGPSSIGYVAYEDPESMNKIITRLSDAAKVLPDPVVVVFYHPFLNKSPERSEDLKILIERVRQEGYRFANICEELAPQ